MDDNGQEWIALDSNGKQWVAMYDIGQQWIEIDYNGLQWIAMDCSVGDEKREQALWLTLITIWGWPLATLLCSGWHFNTVTVCHCTTLKV